MREVDSVRRSLVVVRSLLRYEGDWLSHGIRVNSAPPTKSSVLAPSAGSGVSEPFRARPFALANGEAISGSGKTFAGLETDITRSRARR